MRDELRDAATSDYNENWDLHAELDKRAEFRVANYHLSYPTEADLALSTVSRDIWLLGGSLVEQLDTSPYGISELTAKCKNSAYMRDLSLTPRR